MRSRSEARTLAVSRLTYNIKYRPSGDVTWAPHISEFMIIKFGKFVFLYLGPSGIYSLSM
ncbi:hypothetical protein AG1IA_08624 [Rhizoctonia solani AG-1 IA]|uniref:Uncharacterized protein n=1 Tax=Thanatephorus cucumeris (strain AG1-IA) TaxID=983506 RepID=L8WGR4_THACA|nr:hypothetical protein AG1IA_08624 [Rhizoctonia solani AG-1 IA]